MRERERENILSHSRGRGRPYAVRRRQRLKYCGSGPILYAVDFSYNTYTDASYCQLARGAGC